MDDVRVLSPEAAASLSVEQAAGLDHTIGVSVRWGPGFVLYDPWTADSRPGPGPRTIMSPGFGGHIALADPDAGLSFAYLCNDTRLPIPDPRAQALLDACYRALD